MKMLVAYRATRMRNKYIFSFLCVVFSAIQLAASSPGKFSRALQWKLDVPSELSKSDFERLYTGGMLDERNEEKFEQIQRLRRLQGSKRLGAEHGPVGELDYSDVILRLYRQKDKDKYYKLKIDDATNFKNAPLNKSLETKIIIHGWMNSGESWFPILMKDTLLNDRDLNVILVDWSSVSYGFVYPWTASYVPEVGKLVGEVVFALINDNYINVTSVHFVGHSLGAHVAGFAGKRINKLLNKTVPWITGLDPARPCFNGKPAKDRLDVTDAEYVEIVHTCADYLGLLQPIGHIDFYPNGGSLVQPGCSYYDVGACSHARSFQYYAEALTTNRSFIGYPCANIVDFTLGLCDDDDAAKKMGKKYSADSYGKMFLLTRSSAPFHVEPDDHE
nr:PREDICTED: phospholipase A1-like isoform X1 [Bemisia tabaci]